MNNKIGEVSDLDFKKRKEKHRFSNKDIYLDGITWDYNVKYIDLGEFKTYHSTYIPKVIARDKADSLLFTILLNYATLNKVSIKKETLVKLATIIEERVDGFKFDEDKLKETIDRVMLMKDKHVLRDNMAVRFLKNPYHEFDFVVMNTETKRLKRETNIQIICELILNWDHKVDGKAIYKTLADRIDVSDRTIKRYFSDDSIPDEVKDAWEELKGLNAIKEWNPKPKKLKINFKKNHVKVKKHKKERLSYVYTKPTRTIYQMKINKKETNMILEKKFKTAAPKELTDQILVDKTKPTILEHKIIYDNRRRLPLASKGIAFSVRYLVLPHGASSDYYNKNDNEVHFIQVFNEEGIVIHHARAEDFEFNVIYNRLNEEEKKFITGFIESNQYNYKIIYGD